MVLREKPGPKIPPHAGSWGASSHLLCLPATPCSPSSSIPPSSQPVEVECHSDLNSCPNLYFSTLIDSLFESLFLPLCDLRRENCPLGTSERVKQKGKYSEIQRYDDPASLEMIDFISSHLFLVNGEREYVLKEDGPEDKFFPKVQGLSLSSASPLICCVTTSKTSTFLSLNFLISKMGF